MKHNNHDLKKNLRLLATGYAMGIADLIPGVSGGTIAFLSGIYEELIFSIKQVTGKTLSLALHGKLKEALMSIPFRFLIPLAIGLFGAIFSLASVLSHLLEKYPSFVWSFFFGLVLTSTVIVMKRVGHWSLQNKAGFVLAAIGAYILVGQVPVETPNNPLMTFLSGAIAICAMILPGISGSFILLLLGKYQQILGAVTSRDVVTLGIFMMGCVVGIGLFSRVLSWLFSKHHDISVSVLAGFMLGSVRKIWPWKEVVTTRINSHGVEVPFIENNILPSAFDSGVAFTIMLALIAVGIVYGLERLHLVKEHSDDIDDKAFLAEQKSIRESSSEHI